MSLRVWLPLDGSLRNLGLSNLTLTNTNATITDGKIGQCYNFNNAYIRSAANECNITRDHWSVGCWFYPTVSSSSSHQYIISIHRGSTSGNFQFTFCLNANKLALRCGSTTRTGPNITLNKWQHGMATYDGTNLRFYLNGILTTTTTLPQAQDNTAATLIIGARLGSTGYFPGKLNDVRIYDYCLSAAEVKEISKGLILHYKLDGGLFGNANLLINTHFDSQYSKTTGWDTTKNGTLLASNWDGYNSGLTNASTCYHAHLTLFQNEYVYEFTKENEGWLGISQGSLQTKLVAGKTYIFSCEQYSVTNTNYMTGGLYYYKTDAASAGFHLGYISCDTNRKVGIWQKYTYTFTAPTDGNYSKAMRWYCYGHTGGAGTFYLRHLKLEEDSVATTWCPADSEFNIDRNIIEDSSGYGKNGTVIGTLSSIANAAKYSVATYSVTGANNYITTPTLYLPTDAITLNIWFKSSNTSPTGNYHIVVDSNSNREWYEMAIYKGGYFRGGLHINGTRQVDNCTSTTGCDGQWHMLTLTYDGEKVQRYFDGVMEKETNVTISSGLRTSTALTLFRNGPNANYACVEAALSDFRIYCTPLLDTDIKMLYNISMSIDKSKKIHTFEIVENNSNSISKSGLLNCNEINEITSLTNVQNQSDGDWNAIEFIER